MARLPALNASQVLDLVSRRRSPLLEASDLLMTRVATAVAEDDVLLPALFHLVADFIALETHLLVAFERIVRFLSAEDATEPLSVIRAVPRHVAEEVAVMALDSRVLLSPVALALQLSELVELVFIIEVVHALDRSLLLLA